MQQCSGFFPPKLHCGCMVSIVTREREGGREKEIERRKERKKERDYKTNFCSVLCSIKNQLN